MMSGTPYKQGDVVLVAFPFTNLKGAKQRPVLILSPQHHNMITEDIVVCGITTNLSDETNSVLINQKDMAEGDIHFTSRIKVDKLFTLEQNLIIRKLGRVNATTLTRIKNVIKKLFIE